jgi:hypothetical protein
LIADPAIKASVLRTWALKWRDAISSRLSPASWPCAAWRSQPCAAWPAGSRAAAGRSGRRFTGLGIWPEVGAARRRELRFFGDHAGRHATDIGNLGTAEPERVAAAGLLLLGRVALAGGGRNRNRHCHGQQPSKPEIPCSKNRHPSPRPKLGRIVGERIRIRKHRRTARHSTDVAAVWTADSKFGSGGWYSWVGSNHRPPVPQTGALTN